MEDDTYKVSLLGFAAIDINWFPYIPFEMFEGEAVMEKDPYLQPRK